jgi:hypothetical protein
MKILKVGFPTIINDNEDTYFKHLEGVVTSLDQYATISANKKPEGILIRITPSDYKSLLTLITEIKKLNTTFGIVVDFSKSMKSSNNICYTININF